MHQEEEHRGQGDQQAGNAQRRAHATAAAGGRTSSCRPGSRLPWPRLSGAGGRCCATSFPPADHAAGLRGGVVAQLVLLANDDSRGRAATFCHVPTSRGYCRKGYHKAASWRVRYACAMSTPRRSVAACHLVLGLVCLFLFPAWTAAQPAPAPPPAQDEASDDWYVVEMFGQRSGYAHFETRPTTFRGQPAWRTLQEVRNELARQNGGLTERMVISTRVEWVEDPAGHTLYVESRNDLGGGESVTIVEVQGKTAELRTSSSTGERRQQIPWDDEALAPRKVEQEIDELLAGKRDRVRFATFSLEAGNRVLEVEARLLERHDDGSVVLEQEMLGLGLKTRETYDATGDLLEQQVGPVIMRRADRKEALAPVTSSLGAFRQLTVALDRDLPAPRQLRRAAFRLVPRKAGETVAGAELFPEDRRQHLEVRDGAEVLRVEVPDLKTPPPPDPSFDPAPYLQPSSLIESDDAQIRALAARVAGGQRDLAAAHRLERWVHDNVGFSGAGIGLGTARQTLDSRDGDCTENAFLLAALLRAAGIPSRVVVGLVYAGQRSFMYHAWAEGHVEGGWVAFDSAIHADRVDATHLAMARSAGGEEGAVLEMAMPLLTGMGRFDLAWVEP